MNFFGHAAVASWYDADPRFVLGAMLPDFSSMLGLAPLASDEPRIARGIALHHATDAAFHGIPEFVSATSRARAWLSARGLGRGAARAAAHVGTEILLDEALAEDAASVRAYLGALERAPANGAAIAWQPAEAVRGFELLVRTLSERGVGRSAADPALVAARLARALARRPRLALAGEDELAVREWVTAARPEVARFAPVLIAELRARLLTPGPFG